MATGLLPGQRPTVHVETPLVHSPLLSSIAKCNIFLKLENGQPSGSFKSRGLGTLATKGYNEGKRQFISSSGGNAGLAAAYSSLALGGKCTVCVPSSTKQDVKERLGKLGAKVIVSGKDWYEADQEARKLVDENPDAMYLPPFDHDDIVKGNATMVPELQKQWTEWGNQNLPDAVIASVGGGGLLAGILKGCQNTSWEDVNIIASETFGAASLDASLKATFEKNPPELTIAKLDSINTIATTLGARAVTPRIVQGILDHNGGVKNVVMSDARAVDAIKQFGQDHQILVEPACSVSLAVAYEPKILAKALPKLNFESTRSAQEMFNQRNDKSVPNIIIIVCGGSGISPTSLETYSKEYELKDDDTFTVGDWK